MYPINSFTIGFIWQCFIFIPAWIYNACNIYFDSSSFKTLENNQSSTRSFDDYLQYTKPDYYYDDEIVINIHPQNNLKKSSFLPNKNFRCSNSRCSIELPIHGELFVLGDGLWCKHCWNSEFMRIKRCFQSP